MRFSELCEKEVINVGDCRCLGSVRDLDIKKMNETRELKKGESVVYVNSFHVF